MCITELRVGRGGSSPSEPEGVFLRCLGRMTWQDASGKKCGGQGAETLLLRGGALSLLAAAGGVCWLC